MSLVDSFGRTHDDLRLSVTDRCNLRCAYCMPADPVWFPRDTLLSYEELARVAAILVGAGVRKLRITGGEPLVRRDLDRLVRLLAAIDGVEDLSLTTNALLLDRQAPALAAAGLRRINVSLDTLDAERYLALTRRDALDRALAGIAAAARAGLAPIKVNTVLIRGVNDDEVESLVARSRDEGWELRFIEYMPLDNEGRWQSDRVVTGEELRRRIGARWPLEADVAADPHAPARRWRFADGIGSIGFIDSISRPFCAECSRLRLTADGQFRVCLYDGAETDLKSLLRAGADDATLLQTMRVALSAKGRGGALEIAERRAPLPLGRTMHQIGG